MTQTDASHRNIGIDVLKCVCALFVVMIHAPFRIHLAPYTVALARVAVPLFFVITGYYFPKMEEKQRTGGHLRKIGMLAVASCVFYFLLHVCYINAYPQRYLNHFVHPQTIFNFLAYNVCPAEGHLWYFFALIYALPILMALHRTHTMRFLTYSIPLLLTANYLLTFTGHYEYYRNWLFTALPYMGIGIFFRNHPNSFAHRLPTRAILACYLTLCALLYLEWDWYYQHHAVAYRDDYLCTPWMVICLFLIAIKERKENLLTKTAAYIGRKYSPYIYIFHIAVKSCFHFWKGWKVIPLIYPVWIFGFTLFLCAACSCGIAFIRKYYRKVR